MSTHEHRFVETYSGLVGFGLARETDEKTIIYYLQKLSDDRLMELLVKRFSDDELAGIFNWVSGILKKHLSEDEYHRWFLKDDHS
jgi:hypothetical protein